MSFYFLLLSGFSSILQIEGSAERTSRMINVFNECLVDNYPPINMDDNISKTNNCTNQTILATEIICDKSRKRNLEELSQEKKPDLEPGKWLKAGGEEIPRSFFLSDNIDMQYSYKTFNYLCDDQEVKTADLDVFNKNRRQQVASLLTGQGEFQASENFSNDGEQNFKEELRSNIGELKAYFTDDEPGKLNDINIEEDTNDDSDINRLLDVRIKSDGSFENNGAFHQMSDTLSDVKEHGFNTNSEINNNLRNLERGENSTPSMTQDTIEENELVEEPFLGVKCLNIYRSKVQKRKLIKHCRKKFAVDCPETKGEINCLNTAPNVSKSCLLNIAEFFITTGPYRYKYLDGINVVLSTRKGSIICGRKIFVPFMLVIRNILWQSDINQINLENLSPKNDHPMKYDEKTNINHQLELFISSLIFSELTKSQVKSIRFCFDTNDEKKYFIEIKSYDELIPEMSLNKNTEEKQHKNNPANDERLKAIREKLDKWPIGNEQLKRVFGTCWSILYENDSFKSVKITTRKLLSFQQDLNFFGVPNWLDKRFNQYFNRKFLKMADEELFSFFNGNFVEKACYFTELFSLQEIFLREPEILNFKVTKSCALLFLLLRFNDAFSLMMSEISNSMRSCITTKLFIREFILKDIFEILNLPQRLIITYLWFSRLEYFFLINNPSFEMTEFNPFVMLFFSFLDIGFYIDVHLIRRIHFHLFRSGLSYKVASEMVFMVFGKKANLDGQNNNFDFLKRLYGYLLRNNQMIYGIQECNKLLEDIEKEAFDQKRIIMLIEEFYKTIIDSLWSNMRTSNP